MFQSTEVKVPDEMKEEDWLYLLRHCDFITARKKYYTYLFKTEKAQLKARKKKDENRILHAKKKLELEKNVREGKIEPFKNSFLLFMQDRTMNSFYTNNLTRALFNGPHLIFDFSFEEHHKMRDLINLLRQVHN